MITESKDCPITITTLTFLCMQDNSTNLLQYIVRVYCREHDQNAGKNEAQLRLPLPVSMQHASQISLTELDSQLHQLKHQVQSHRKKVRIVQLPHWHRMTKKCYFGLFALESSIAMTFRSVWDLYLHFYERRTLLCLSVAKHTSICCTNGYTDDSELWC